jgi:hypothetical protein
VNILQNADYDAPHQKGQRLLHVNNDNSIAQISSSVAYPDEVSSNVAACYLRIAQPNNHDKATTTMPKLNADTGAPADSPSRLIDGRIRELGDWRGETLARVRALIHQADAEVLEEWKWRGVPVWSHAGIICTGETYKSVVKLTFAKGASLDDPSGLFNSSLEGNTRRAIDIPEGGQIDEQAFQQLVRAAVALNLAATAKRKTSKA